MSSDTSIVGDLINFRGLVYAPLNENGVIYLFGKVTEDLHMYVEEIKPGYPDCIARRFTGKGWERIRVEFEFRSSNFKLHGHDPKDCDVIVCWTHDWKDCPIEVIELKAEIQDMDNPPIKRPGKGKEEDDFEKTIEALFDRAGAQAKPRKWWATIQDELLAKDEEIWFNIGRKFVGMYSPEKSFAFFSASKTSIQFECFTRGGPLKGTKVSNRKFSPRWGRFTVKADTDVAATIPILLEAQARLKVAIKAGEPTSYYSGGQPFARKGAAGDEVESDETSES